MLQHRLYIFFFFSFIFFSHLLIAQGEKENLCPSINNKKAEKLYKEAQNKKKYDKKERLKFLREALELEPDYVEANFMLAEELIKTARVEGQSFKNAEKYLQVVLNNCPDYSPYTYFYLAQIRYGERKYTECAQLLDQFMKNVDLIKKDEDYNLAEQMKKSAKNLAEIFENPRPFNPVSVAEVSTKDDEYLAVISPDNELLLFTRRLERKKLDDLTPRTVEEFSYAKRIGDNLFEVGRAFGHPFNLGDHYGGASLTPDNKHMYLTICKPYNGRVNCDIYVSDFINGQWTEPKNLGPNINTPDGWEAQPTISADNKTLYFASARAGSKGMDIYKAERDATGNWGPAQNVGPPINTDGNEKSPFLHSDSQTLYFSSDGHPGVGKYDIFYVKTDEKGKWNKPKNLGYPINSEEDEVGFFVSTDGKLGYFSSNSIKGPEAKGGYDIFSFELYKEAQPEQVVFIKGEVKTSEGKPPENAIVEIKNPETKQKATFEVDANDGKYVAVVAVKKPEQLTITVKQPDMAFQSQLVKVEPGNPYKPVVANAEMSELKVGGTYRLNNINYKTNSAELTKESLLILDELINFLNENPNIKLAIHGHTDDVGNDAANLALSTDRAFSVTQYLQEKGISKDRLQFKGFGETKPLVPNTSEANRAINRRTEFVIIEM
jgi:outer membrane protein OmpA-like peptidoglycan-associated protein